MTPAERDEALRVALNYAVRRADNPGGIKRLADVTRACRAAGWDEDRIRREARPGRLLAERDYLRREAEALRLQRESEGV